MTLIGPSLFTLGPWVAATGVVLLAPIAHAARVVRRRIGKGRNQGSQCGRCRHVWSFESRSEASVFDGVLICDSCASHLRSRLGYILPALWVGTVATLALSLAGYLTVDPNWKWSWNGIAVPGGVILLAPTALLGAAMLIRLKSGKTANDALLAKRHPYGGLVDGSVGAITAGRGASDE